VSCSFVRFIVTSIQTAPLKSNPSANDDGRYFKESCWQKQSDQGVLPVLCEIRARQI
jgi:hypothetical protein